MSSSDSLSYILNNQFDVECWEFMQQKLQLCNSQYSFYYGFPRFDDIIVYLLFFWENHHISYYKYSVVCIYIIHNCFTYETVISLKVVKLGKKVDKYVEWALKYHEMDTRYFEDDLINHFNLNSEGGICDGYCHHYSCLNYLIEAKSSSHIKKALKQLRNTADQLINRGEKIEKAIIICDKIPRSERMWYRRDSKNNKLCRRDSAQQIYLMGKIEIDIHYKKNITQWGVSCLFG